MAKAGVPLMENKGDKTSDAIGSRILALEYQRSLDFRGGKSYDFLNVEVREFTFNRCPIQ
jgi:hypothetical protein